MAELTKHSSALILCTRASLAAARDQWNEALNLSRQSLSKDSSNIMAREILIRALTECGYQNEALKEARNLVDHNSNQETLFLLARVANANHSSSEEIEALSRLVNLARLNKQPLGASLAYLGQAYARKGDRGNALRSFQESIASPELSEEEKHHLRDIMDHLMEGNASSTTLPPLHPPEASKEASSHGQ